MPNVKRKNGRPAKGFATTTNNPAYTPDELEFMRAIDAYKQSKGRPFPTWCEVLAVVKALGYRKAA